MSLGFLLVESMALMTRPSWTLFCCLCLMVLFPQAGWSEDDIRPGETLDVEQCIAIGLKRHPGILGAQGTLEASRSRVSSARSGYYPQIGLLGGYSRTHPAGTSGVLGSGNTSYDEYRSSFSLDQTLFDFGKTGSGVDVSVLGEDASRSDLADTTGTIVLKVKQAYYGVLQARHSREAYAQSVGQYEQHLAQARRFYEVGIRPKADVTKAEVDLTQARLNLLKAENSLRIAKITLNNAMGVPTAPGYEVKEDTALKEVPIDLEGALKRGYESRPDLAAARSRREAAQRSVDLARTGHYPVLSGNAGYGWAGQDFPLDRQWSVGATVNVPLFSGYLTTSQVAEARANLVVARANEDTILQGIRFDVEQAYYNLTDAREGIVLAEVSVRQAKENRELAQGRYAAGVGSAIEVTDALVSEISSKTAYNNALYFYQLAVANLEKAMGVTR